MLNPNNFIFFFGGGRGAGGGGAGSFQEELIDNISLMFIFTQLV